jgi:hypothetical protein
VSCVRQELPTRCKRIGNRSGIQDDGVLSDPGLLLGDDESATYREVRAAAQLVTLGIEAASCMPLARALHERSGVSHPG